MKRIFEDHKLLLTLLLFLIVSLISIYLTDLNGHIWSFLGMNNDGRFHVMRMEGLYEALKYGQFFPVVNMSFLGGFGYISNIFYANLWLYPVAFLRLIGLTTIQSFIVFYIVLNFVTFLISFGTYYQVSRNYDKSLLFSFIYTLSVYRIFDMVRRFDIGETLTLTFLPIVILGIYEIFYGDENKWLYLTLGMVMVIYSHALSPILIAIFIFWIILFRIKILIKEPQRILKLFYAGIVSLALSLAYFLPMFEQLKHTQFKLTNSPLIDVSQSGMTIKQLFSWSVTNDLYNQNIGLIMLIVAIIIPFIIWKIKTPVIRDFSIIGEILLFMTTDLFPWKFFVKTPLNMIQFPWRLDMLITILFAICLASDPLNWFNSDWKKIIIVMLTLGLIVNSEDTLIRNHPYEYDSYKSFNELDVYSIGGGEEYLPQDANLSDLHKAAHVPVVKSGTAKIKNFSQQGSKLAFDFQNAKNATITIPIIAYYGYSSKESTGQVSRLTMDQKSNGLGKITINGSGCVEINYYKTFIQKGSKILSGISLLVLILCIIFKKRMKNRVSLINK
ncbi:hypothetical protein [Companilactobacillus musae]|uniref:hypothetical protein n=1 Tax=Companilactobacillus musae TaxID=1903258 RepID=UPI000E649FBC|nr:hypothetical protein [Companilactobacillus musae]